MAQIFAISVLEMPNQVNFATATNPCPTHAISPTKIQDVSPLSAGQQTAYPAANAAIVVSYFEGQQAFTGSYIVGQTVDQIITAANA